MVPEHGTEVEGGRAWGGQRFSDAADAFNAYEDNERRSRAGCGSNGPDFRCEPKRLPTRTAVSSRGVLR